MKRKILIFSDAVIAILFFLTFTFLIFIFYKNTYYVNTTFAEKILTLYPVTDACGFVVVKHKGQRYYLFLDDKNNETMRDLLRKYGVAMAR